MGFDVVSLQNPSGTVLTEANKQQRCEFCQDFLQSMKQYPITYDLVMKPIFNLDGFVNKYNMRS
jgi:hypothetical protein